MITLRDLTLDECLVVREWRNDPVVLPMLRTGAKTIDEQTAFYHDVIQNPAADHRYWAIDRDGVFVGMGGLTYLSRVPGEAEISLLFGPEYRRKGYGVPSVETLLQQARIMGLVCVMGECYPAGPVKFWQTCIERLAQKGWQAGAAVRHDGLRFWWLVR